MLAGFLPVCHSLSLQLNSFKHIHVLDFKRNQDTMFCVVVDSSSILSPFGLAVIEHIST